MVDRVTMADVAREAGVSLMTVSRVVNDKGEVSEDTRQRVTDVIERTGYRPSGIARGLATKRTGTLGLVVPDVANPFFSEVARGAEHVAYAENYNVFLCNTEEDTARELAILQSLEEKRVDGIVVCSSRLEDADLRDALAQYHAAVLVNRRLEDNQVGAILLDDRTGGRIATEHLLQAGHQSLGFLSGPQASRSGRERMEGFRAACASSLVPSDPGWSRHCSPMVKGGYQAGLDLLTAHPHLTALLCYNDLVAVGALQACARLQRRVPEDVGVVGFDDIPLAALVTPSLTTCRAPRYELGARAVRLLLSQLQGCPEECSEIVLQPELIVRDSAP